RAPGRRLWTGEMSTDGLELDGYMSPAGWNGSLHPVESQDSMSATEVEIDKGGKAQQDGDAARYEVCSEATSGWTRRLVRNPL
uniref:Uncharacterized protein n=1 Tax=Aegilops tauschii subsp. strangulata TaxID=200361 RepID=A0A453FY39_AEGTS